MAVAVSSRHGSTGLDSSTIALVAIVLVGALVRFSTLGEQSFWLDESFTYGIVARDLGHAVATIPRTESTPPLYYVLGWLWVRVFGLSEVGLRSFSALCGTLMIPVLWEIGRRLISPRVGLVAALLAAVNPFLFWYSQEARAYSLLLLLSSLSLLAVVRARERPSRQRLLFWGAIVAAALCTHYFSAFLLVPEAAWLLISLRGRGCLTGEWLVCTLALPVVAAAALVTLAMNQNDGRARAAVTGSLLYRIGNLAKLDIIGEGQPHKAWLDLIGAVFVAIAAFLLVRRGTRRERVGVLLPLALGGTAVLLALAVALLVRDYFIARNMLETWPAFGVSIAAGLGVARAGRMGALAIAGLVALSLYCVSNVIRDPVFQRDDWRGAARALGSPGSPRAIVTGASAVPLEPYLPRLAPYQGGQRVSEVDVIWINHSSFGAPVTPLQLRPLPGFQAQEIRSDSYIDVRYRSPQPRFEEAVSLNRLYPVNAGGLTLLQFAVG